MKAAVSFSRRRGSVPASRSMMRCAEARRVALIRLGDEGLMEQAALSDPAPLVRRRMVRELHHIDILQKIADEDPDDSVRAEAGKRLGQL